MLKGSQKERDRVTNASWGGVWVTIREICKVERGGNFDSENFKANIHRTYMKSWDELLYKNKP